MYQDMQCSNNCTASHCFIVTLINCYIARLIFDVNLRHEFF
jgi:hypothetical protein